MPQTKTYRFEIGRYDLIITRPSIDDVAGIVSLAIAACSGIQMLTNFTADDKVKDVVSTAIDAASGALESLPDLP